MKNRVKFENDNTLVAEGICDVSIMRKDVKMPVIFYVLYISSMKNKILNIEQLIEMN